MLAVAILVVGLGSAGLIYLRASDAVPYEPDETKEYLRTLELYGGTFNVVATEVRQWLSSLWHGKRLALTVALVTVAAAFTSWVLSRVLERGDPGDGAR